MIPKTLYTLLVAAIVLLLATPAIAQIHSTSILLLVDVSGSMDDRIEGERKIDIAKEAATELVQSLNGVNVGLRIFPSSGCNSMNVVNIQPIESNRLTLLEEIDGLRARGSTPLATALKDGRQDFSPIGDKIIVLLSDGEETCGGDPIQVARELAGQGHTTFMPSLTIGPLASSPTGAVASPGDRIVVNAIGFDISEEGEQQLREIAAITGGSYYAADDKESLKQAVQQAASTGSGWVLWLIVIAVIAAVAILLVFVVTRSKKKVPVSAQAPLAAVPPITVQAQTTPTQAPPATAQPPVPINQQATQQNPTGFCSNCGSKLIAGSSFCPSCGKAL